MLYFVYELVDPRTDAVAYVGITDNPNRRFQAHLSDTETNDGKRMWVEQLQSEGLEPRMRILEIVETKEEALEREKHLIRHYTRLGEQLTNISHHGVKARSRTRSSGPEYYCSAEEIAEELNLITDSRRSAVNWDGSD
jgi:predicted GIY-YIG superfamily endonuclease